MSNAEIPQNEPQTDPEEELADASPEERSRDAAEHSRKVADEQDDDSGSDRN
jgi:hypothetical protein